MVHPISESGSAFSGDRRSLAAQRHRQSRSHLEQGARPHGSRRRVGCRALVGFALALWHGLNRRLIRKQLVPICTRQCCDRVPHGRHGFRLSGRKDNRRNAEQPNYSRPRPGEMADCQGHRLGCSRDSAGLLVRSAVVPNPVAREFAARSNPDAPEPIPREILRELNSHYFKRFYGVIGPFVSRNLTSLVVAGHPDSWALRMLDGGPDSFIGGALEMARGWGEDLRRASSRSYGGIVETRHFGDMILVKVRWIPTFDGKRVETFANLVMRRHRYHWRIVALSRRRDHPCFDPVCNVEFLGIRYPDQPNEPLMGKQCTARGRPPSTP